MVEVGYTETYESYTSNATIYKYFNNIEDGSIPGRTLSLDKIDNIAAIPTTILSVLADNP